MKKLYLIFALFFLLGCTDSKQPKRIETNSEVEADNGVQTISHEIISDILQSIPSPLEISLLIQKIAFEYDNTHLSTPSFVTNYNTSFRQALNLGIYSTDLGYANLYNKNQDVLDFLKSVKKLADDLNIGQFFDYHTIKKIAQTSNNLDSLLQMTQQNFEAINRHLQEQQRENLSILILTGGWVEAVYLSTLVYENTKNEQLREKIAEQKIALDQILLVLDVYRTKPNFGDLINDLKELQKIYARVKIITTPGESLIVEREGTLVFEQGMHTSVEVDEKDLQSINSLVRSIRNKIIK